MEEKLTLHWGTNGKKLQVGHSRPKRRKNFLAMKVVLLEDEPVVLQNSVKRRLLSPTPRDGSQSLLPSRFCVRDNTSRNTKHRTCFKNSGSNSSKFISELANTRENPSGAAGAD